MPPDEPVDPTATAPAIGASEAEPAATSAVEPASPAPAAEPSADSQGADGAVTPHTDTPTLLETGAPEPASEEKPAEPAAPEPEKPADPVAEPKPAEPPPEAAPEVVPVVYEFTMPEGIKAEPEQLSAYTDVLREAGVAPEAGQRLLDMHAAEIQRHAVQTLTDQHRIFGETRAGWRQAIAADEELGGAGHRTTMAAAARVRDLLVPEERREAFNDFLRVTGAGDHPEFIRVLARAAKYFDEAPAPAHTGRPTPDTGRPPGQRGKRGILYDHPSSTRQRG